MFAYIDDLVGGSTGAQVQGFVARMLADQKAATGEYSKPTVDPRESDMNAKVVFDYAAMSNPSRWITQRYGPDVEEELAPVAEAPRALRVPKKKLKAPAMSPEVAAEVQKMSRQFQDAPFARSTALDETTWDPKMIRLSSPRVQPAVVNQISLKKGDRNYVPPAIYFFFEQFMDSAWSDTKRRAALQSRLRKYVVPKAGAADRFLEPVAQGMLRTIYGDKPKLIEGILRHFGAVYEAE